jgi:soluble lytic murein transglycosylase-like protein
MNYADRTASVSAQHHRAEARHTRPSRSARREPAGRAQFAGLVERHAAEAGVSPALAYAMVEIESGFNPDTTGRAGEIGLMQSKYETARSMGYDGDRRGLYDPDTNLRYGMKYLAAAQQAGGGSTCATVLKYQGGLRATRHSAWTRQSCGRAEDLMRRA